MKGRIEQHGKGMSSPSRAEILKRAREIALIEGRPDGAVTEEDEELARRELQEEDVAVSSDEARSDVVATHNPADLAVQTGRRVENLRPQDEQSLMESEVEEGIREAEHERMVRGFREGKTGR